MNSFAELLREEAAACQTSAGKNPGPTGDAFQAMFVMLNSLADRAEESERIARPPTVKSVVRERGKPDTVTDITGTAAEKAETGAVRSSMYPPGAKFPARYDLLFRNAAGLRRLAEAYGEGVAKYGPDNWMNGFPESVMVSHALEHFRLFMAGDTSEDHLAHAAWNVMTLIWIQENKPELLDLTKPQQKA